MVVFSEPEYTRYAQVWVFGDSSARALYPEGTYTPTQVGLGQVVGLPSLKFLHLISPILSLVDLHDLVSETLLPQRSHPDFLVIHGGTIDANLRPLPELQAAISRVMSTYNDLCSLCAPKYQSPHLLQTILWSTPLPRPSAPLNATSVSTMTRFKQMNAHAGVTWVRIKIFLILF